MAGDFLGLDLKVTSQKELAKKKKKGRIGFYSPWRRGDLLSHKHPESCLSESRTLAAGSNTALWGPTASPGEQKTLLTVTSFIAYAVATAVILQN